MKTILLYSLTFFLSITVYSQSNPIDTILVNKNKNFHVQIKDTMVNALDPARFPDFNNDHNKDIMLSYRGNNPTYILYLFNPEKIHSRMLKGMIIFLAEFN